MLTGKEFVLKIKEGNQPLFDASCINVKAYFNGHPSKEELVDHFIGRMVNERMNMVEIAQTIASLPANTPADELELLSKQAHDEAVHFRLVKNVIEHITGEPLDLQSAINTESKNPTAKGASLLAKYGAENDPLALAAYQLVAEGRAEAVWDQMAECIEDDFISRSYARIARDEGFHANIGARKLESLATTVEAQEKVEELVNNLRKDLFEISCMNTVEVPAAKELVANAYGW